MYSSTLMFRLPQLVAFPVPSPTKYKDLDILLHITLLSYQSLLLGEDLMNLVTQKEN